MRIHCNYLQTFQQLTLAAVFVNGMKYRPCSQLCLHIRVLTVDDVMHNDDMGMASELHSILLCTERYMICMYMYIYFTMNMCEHTCIYTYIHTYVRMYIRTYNSVY